MSDERQVERAWLFFQTNKTFSLTLFRIFMDMNVRDANKWLATAHRLGMVDKVDELTFKSTGKYLNRGESFIPGERNGN